MKEGIRNLMELVRSVFWFERGELSGIIACLNAQKPRFEAYWEVQVLLCLTAGVLFAFIGAGYWGLLILWLSKSALRSLHRKRFFDPMDWKSYRL